MFPHLLKTMQVLPLLKKPGLDRVNPATYQPFSNLCSILKIVERLVLVHLQPHLLASGNFNPLLSAYGPLNKIALLRMMDSFYRAADDKMLTTLISLDISAAFDTISHGILL